MATIFMQVDSLMHALRSFLCEIGLLFLFCFEIASSFNGHDAAIGHLLSPGFCLHFARNFRLALFLLLFRL